MTPSSHTDTTPGIPRMSHRLRSATFLALLASLLLAAGMVLATASSAAAHDSIVSATPEADATIGVVPQEISLTFSGEILTAGSAVVIEVITPGGQNLATEPPQIVGTTVTQALTGDQGPGLYTVRWRVVSSDGHPISDEYTYTLESVAIPDNTSTPAPTATEQTPEPSPTSSAAAESEDDGYGGQASGGGEIFPVLAVISGVIIVAGVLVVVLMVARERRRRDRAAAAQAESSTSGKTDGS